MKKFLALILALLIAMSIVACGGTGNGGNNGGTGGGEDFIYNSPGDQKVKISISNPTGGVGQKWIAELAEEFAKRNVETDFGDGKTGVYIEVVPEKGRNVDSIKGTSTHILVQAASYPALYAATGDLYNLDEIYFDKTREGGTLEEKLFPGIKTRLITKDNHCYGLPVADFFSGISYNAGLFEEIGAYLLLDQNGAGTSFYSPLTKKNYKFGTSTLQLSYGPDGVPGTMDDGLPASLEEVIVLMEYIKNRGYYPVALSGAHNYYSNYFFAGMMTALAGAEQMNNYYNSEGEIEVVAFDNNGEPLLTEEPIFAGVDYIKKPVTRKVNLNSDNGYLVGTMVAKYYTTALFEIMKKNGFFSPEASNPSVSHYDAQQAFLTGSASGFTDSAMLIDASYWFNETIDQGNFVIAKVNTGKSKEDFDIRFMPLPTSYYFDANRQALSEPIPAVLNNEGCYELVVNNDIKSDAVLEKAIVAFLKFMYAEEQIKSKTISTGMTMAVEVDMTEEDLGKMDSFYRYIYLARAKNASNVVFQTSQNDSFVKNRNLLRLSLSYNHFPNAYERLGTKNTLEYFKANIIPETKWVK